MNQVRIRIVGKFDRVGEQEIANKVVSVPGVVPIRWRVRLFGFINVTLVGRVEVSTE